MIDAGDKAFETLRLRASFREGKYQKRNIAKSWV